MNKILPFIPAAIVIPFLIWGMFGPFIALGFIGICLVILFAKLIPEITNFVNTRTAK